MDVLIRLGENALMPTNGSSGAAGYDLYSAEEVLLLARSAASVKTNVAFKIPNGYFGEIKSRSGHSFKHHLETGAGVIDSDYTGFVNIKIYNHSDKDYLIKQNERVAQIIFQRYMKANFVKTNKMPETKRGDKGFGSSGKGVIKSAYFDKHNSQRFSGPQMQTGTPPEPKSYLRPDAPIPKPRSNTK